MPGGGTRFVVWAPRVRRAAVRLLGPTPRDVPMRGGPGGLFEAVVPDVGAGRDYFIVLDDGRALPDPASRHQPEGVHGPSRTVDPGAFAWTDADWGGLALEDYVVYEAHVGTFTPEGTFDAAIGRLPYLRELGVTALEIMPVAQFPGARNWGYDGVSLFAPQSTYGGAEGLRRLVDACHAEGIALVLDVVYNHLGPEGNYLGRFGPFFTDRYGTPWGEAVNLDQAGSDGVRAFFIDNALHWLTEYHVDALRLDAVHAIFDFSARPFLAELADAWRERAAQLGRRAHLIAESSLNDPRVIRPPAIGGHGLDAQWTDDFHHAVHALLTGDRHGYFADFGRVDDLRKALLEGFVYDGRFSAFRGRRHGAPATDRPARQHVFCVQNHDQIANANGSVRLSGRVSPPARRLAATLLLCAPGVPMLFMGQELDADTPFHYFVSHGDPELNEAVRRGRQEEHAAFHAAFPAGSFVDPASEEAFESSKIDWACVAREPHAAMLRLYRDLIALRRRLRCLGNARADLARAVANESPPRLSMWRGDPGGEQAVLLANIGPSPAAVEMPWPGEWRLALWSDDPAYAGAGEATVAPPPASVTVGGDRAGEVALGPWSAALFVSARGY